MNLKPFIESIEKQNLNVEGVIVHKKGMEESRYRWMPETRRNVFSVSKSFTAIAIGMAIDEGKLKLASKLCDFFRNDEVFEEQEIRWNSITLEHLLTMTMGHKDFSRPKNLKEALSYKISNEPGTKFFYDNTCTFLASAMLSNATGEKLRDYLLERLFHPLGIEDPQWRESSDGYTTGATDLFLTSSEMSLFGRFLLQRGNWEGKQLVSSSWIDAATRTQVPTRPNSAKPDYNLGYGYYFWTCRHGAFRCDGKDGQFIIVIPSLDAVISINSDEENLEPILYTVWDHILPALKNLN